MANSSFNTVLPLKVKHSDQQHISHAHSTLPLKVCIEEPLQAYLVASDGENITDLYQTILSEVESTLFRVILKRYKSQIKASKVLGLNRGTLRKKLKQYRLVSSEEH